MAGIALITTSYPDEVPGAEAAGSFVEDFAIELSKSTAVTVLAASLEASVSNSDNLTVRRFAVPRLPLSLLKPYKPSDWPAVFATLRAGRNALSNLIDDEPPDHVLALWALPSGWWAASVARQRNIPFSTWALGSDIWSLGRIPVIRQILARVLRQAHRRYADGLQLCAEVEKLCGKTCDFLPSSRRLTAVRQTKVSSSPPYKLAFLGRWHPNKGADLLMQSLELLANEEWEQISELRFSGGGPLDAEIRDAALRLQAAGRPVSLGGYLDKDDAAALIAWADFLLLPSRIESIPVIFSDAVQIGTPIVSTPVGDLPRLFDRYRAGILAREASPSGYADAIREALSGNAAGYCANLQSAANDFDIMRATERLLDDVERSHG